MSAVSWVVDDTRKSPACRAPRSARHLPSVSLPEGAGRIPPGRSRPLWRLATRPVPGRLLLLRGSAGVSVRGTRSSGVLGPSRRLRTWRSSWLLSRTSSGRMQRRRLGVKRPALETAHPVGTVGHGGGVQRRLPPGIRGAHMGVRHRPIPLSRREKGVGTGCAKQPASRLCTGRTAAKRFEKCCRGPLTFARCLGNGSSDTSKSCTVAREPWMALVRVRSPPSLRRRRMSRVSRIPSRSERWIVGSGV